MYLYGAGYLEHGLVQEPIPIGILAGKPADIDKDAHVPAQLFQLSNFARFVRTTIHQHTMNSLWISA